MAFPVTGKNVGSGIDQLKAQIVGWIREEIRVSRQGGIGVSLDGSGMLGNDALKSPVAPGLVYQTATNFALSQTMTTKLTTTVTVPPGFTQCAVSLSSRVYAFNSNTTGGADAAGADYIYTRTNIAGIFPVALPILVGGAGHGVDSLDPFSQLLTGLTPGATFALQVEAKTAYLAWAANVTNTVELSGSLLWFR